MSGILNNVSGFPGFTTTNFKINNPVQTSTTFGGKVRRVGLGTNFYSFTVKFPPMPRNNAQPMIGFLASQYGMLDSFQVLLPAESYPRAAYAGTQPTVGASYAAGTKQIQIVASANSAVLKQGDYFKFTGPAWVTATAYTVGSYVSYAGQDYYCHTAHTAGASFDSSKFQLHSKVYMAIADCTSASNGSATLDFACGLLLPINSNTKLNVTAVPFTVMLTNEAQEYEVGIDRTYNLEIDVREVL